MKVIKHKDKWYLQSETGYKEILLSTDTELQKDGVQAIDDEFLEWFVKNPSCEEVEIYREKPIGYTDNIHITFWGLYKIITPKECMITKIMQMDAKMAYDSLPKQEILLEDIFNEEKKKGVKELIDNHKQETLEEAAWRVFGKDDDNFYDGAKWQQEQDNNKYSEEEVVSFIHKFIKEHQPQLPYLIGGINMWFEQFKKK